MEKQYATSACCLIIRSRDYWALCDTVEYCYIRSLNPKHKLRVWQTAKVQQGKGDTYIRVGGMTIWEDDTIYV